MMQEQNSNNDEPTHNGSEDDPLSPHYTGTCNTNPL